MKEIKDIKTLHWIVVVTVFVVIVLSQIFLYWRYQGNVWEVLIETIIIGILAFGIIYFTFREILKREKKLKDTMKELFSSYQYIGNANRHIDMLTNFSKYVTKADFTDEEIIAFVVNTAGRLASADYCTVFLWDGPKKKYRRSKVYYYTDKSIFESINSRMKCESCTSYISDNQFILEVNRESEKKCRNFPDSFWDTYSMICFPIIFKGRKKGFLTVVHNNKADISHLNFKLISSLATQLGTVLK